jgi:hypothetical protein
MTPRPTPDELAALRRLAARAAARSQRPGRFMELARTHGPRFRRLYAARLELQERTDRALARAATELGPDGDGVVGDDLVADVEAVLDELERAPDPELRALAGELRREVGAARGRAVDDLLAGR